MSLLGLLVSVNVSNLVPWCRSEQGLELDLFLLQCCAALARADLYVNRIIDRYGLSSYLSLDLERSSEYVAHSNLLFVRDQMLLFCFYHCFLLEKPNIYFLKHALTHLAKQNFLLKHKNPNYLVYLVHIYIWIKSVLLM